MEGYEKIAKILRTDKDVLENISRKLSKITGHNNVLEKIIAENNEKMERVFSELKVSTKSAGDIYNSLISKIKSDDDRLATFLHQKKDRGKSGFDAVINSAKELSGVGKGFFLKLSKARELIVKNPPQNIIKFLDYKDAKELVDKEDIYEIFAAIRFMEGLKWMNSVFLHDYEKLTPNDFEEREIEAKVLDDKWKSAAVEFTQKKYHNLSHSKEMGFVFIIPIEINIPGTNFMDFSLAMHYFHEVSFYADLFIKYTEEPAVDFSKKLISALRGDVLDTRPSDENLGTEWLIVQRYLAKDDSYDWRLFYPHVNPEAMHWAKVEKDITRISEENGLGLEFWDGLGFVGNFFKDESGVEVLVSFNFLDTVMALFQEKELIKYLYHYEEALWNKIFISYMGEKETYDLMIKNFYKGSIKL